MRNKQCIGYAEFEGKCGNTLEASKNPYWCERCDKIRRETITKNLEDMQDSFKHEEEAQDDTKR